MRCEEGSAHSRAIFADAEATVEGGLISRAQKMLNSKTMFLNQVENQDQRVPLESNADICKHQTLSKGGLCRTKKDATHPCTVHFKAMYPVTSKGNLLVFILTLYCFSCQNVK